MGDEKRYMNTMKNVLHLVFIWFILNGIVSGMVHAQSIDEIFNKFIKRYHTFQGTTLPYHIFKPATYNPQARYPLVLCLHGSGERGDNSSAVRNNTMATVWARDSNQTRWPCFILVPQCPSSGWWTYSNIELTMNDLLDSLQAECSIDTNRLYITGLSMGGYGTWDMIARYPAKFAAAVPVCGGGDPSKAALIKHIPTWNFHGAQDGTVSVTNSRAMISALENAGNTVVYTNCHTGDCTGLSESDIADRIKQNAKLLYTEYQYGGHSIWDQAYNTNFLLPWVFSQSLLEPATGVERVNSNPVPKNTILSQNYPNPFNPSTQIRFSVGTASHISLRVYDVLGREVITVVNEMKPAGAYTVTWNAAAVPSGVYFYRLISDNGTETKKLILSK